jgi:hypothetical protein
VLALRRAAWFPRLAERFPSPSHQYHKAMNAKILHLRKLLLFAGLSLADLALTWLLVRRSGGRVYEANPVAGWWLEHHGWLGLAGFKAGLVLLVIVLTLLISRYRPHFGGLLLGFACSVVTGVLVYSVALAGLVNRHEETELPPVVETHEQYTERMDESREYGHLMDRLAEDLMTGRCSLTEAVARLGCTRKGHDAAWIRQLHICFPDRTDAQCLASNLITYTICPLAKNPPAARKVEQRLSAEFRSAYGVPFIRINELQPEVTPSNIPNEPRPAAPPEGFRPPEPKRLPKPPTAS